MNNKQVSSKLNSVCSNFKVRIEKCSSVKAPNCLNVVISASCLNETLPEYLQLLKSIIEEPVFKQEEIENTLRKYKSEKAEDMLDSGAIQFCLDYASSFINKQGQLFNSYNLVSEGLRIADIGQTPEEFSKIHSSLINKSQMTLIQHSFEANPELLDQLNFKVSDLTETKESKEKE